MRLPLATTSDDLDFLAGGGEMGRLIREYDWSAHPLGKPDAWPRSLKTAVSLILNSQHPMWIGWGEEMSFLYNDAYLHVLGLAKHPYALGRPACQVWAEIWDVCGPLADKVFLEGHASFVDDVRLFMQRGDHLEETYYSLSYSPIRDESGGVGGLFCPSTDTTPKVLGARRLRTLSEMAGVTYAGEMTDAACAMIARELAKNRDDVPFALLYVANAEGTQALLKQTMGFQNGDEFLSPHSVDLRAGNTPNMLWPLAEVFLKKSTRRVSIGRFDAFPRGPADQRVSEAIVLPVVSKGDHKPLGVLIAGMNPTSRADPAYETFFELVATQVGTVIQNARVVEGEISAPICSNRSTRPRRHFFQTSAMSSAHR